MDRIQAMKSPEVRMQFIKEFGLPIDLAEDPYFTQRLITFDCLYGCRKLWDMFLDDIAKYSSLESYRMDCQKKFDTISDWFRVGACQITNEMIVDSLGKCEIDVPDGNEMNLLYNSGKAFLEFSFIDGGYKLLHEFYPSYFQCETWGDLLWAFDVMPHLKYSKVFQEEAMRGLGVRNIQLHYIIHGLLKKKIDNILAKYAQESMKSLIFELSGAVNCDELEKIIYDLPKFVRDSITYEFFVTVPIGEKARFGYVLDYFESGRVEFADVDPLLLNQIVLYMKHDYVMKNDLVFNHNGQKAAFLKPIPNPFTYYPSSFTNSRAY